MSRILCETTLIKDEGKSRLVQVPTFTVLFQNKLHNDWLMKKTYPSFKRAYRAIRHSNSFEGSPFYHWIAIPYHKQRLNKVAMHWKHETFKQSLEVKTRRFSLTY